VPVALLNRDKLRGLCDSRLEEARALLEKRLWTGAYYLTGLAVECALKSCLAGAVREHDFPDKNFVTQMYVHDLEKLFRLNGALWAQLQADIQNDLKLRVNWTTVKDWDDSKRYDVVEELTAKGLHDAATETGSGVIEWIKRRW
jgi:HEPN domain-containing protein